MQSRRSDEKDSDRIIYRITYVWCQKLESNQVKVNMSRANRQTHPRTLKLVMINHSHIIFKTNYRYVQLSQHQQNHQPQKIQYAG